MLSTDLAAPYLELGRARAAKLSLQNIAFETADAEDLSKYPDASFDAVTCSLVGGGWRCRPGVVVGKPQGGPPGLPCPPGCLPASTSAGARGWCTAVCEGGMCCLWLLP